MTSTSTVAVKARTEFEDYFIESLKDIYWAEKHISKGLKKMCRATTSPELADAFMQHEQEGVRHLEIVERIFGLLGHKPQTKKCAAMEGLLEEAEEVISDTERNSFVRDAALIMAAQKVEHYEIATYGTLRVLSEYLPHREIKELLGEVLESEKKADANLTRIAEAYINKNASEE